MRRVSAAGGIGLVAAIVLAAAAGCGGESGSKTAKVPTASTGDGGAAAPVATTPSTEPEVHADVSGAAKGSYDQGWQAYERGDLAGAKAAFTDATRKDPKAGAAHHALGVVYERLGNLSDAQQEYRTAFSVQPDYEVAMGAYALSLAHSGHTGEADTFLTDKHQRNPSSPRITTYLSSVKSLEGDSGSAQQLAQDALKNDPNFREAMVAIARDHQRTHKTELALYALQAILDGFGDAAPARDKDNAEAHLLRGLIEKETGKRAAAMTDFAAANAKRPDLVEAAIQLGVMKLEAGNAAEAVPLLESSVRFAPMNPTAHVNLGDGYRLLGRTPEAKREFETALQLDSTLAVAHYDMGLLYLFTPSVPGFTPIDQVGQAMKELETYKNMRGNAKAAPGTNDDVDDLLSRAKAKQAELRAPAPAPPPPPAASGAAPAAAADGGS